MTKYLAGVLTVIAAGVLLIAYGLLAPGAAASFSRDDAIVDLAARPMALPAGTVQGYVMQPVAMQAVAVPAAGMQAVAPAVVSYPYATPASLSVPASEPRSSAPVRASATRARSVSRVEAPRRDWKKTALVIGGSSAAGAGVGGIFGGKKGALIGAAIGGGASTIYETTRK